LFIDSGSGLYIICHGFKNQNAFYSEFWLVDGVNFTAKPLAPFGVTEVTGENVKRKSCFPH